MPASTDLDRAVEVLLDYLATADPAEAARRLPGYVILKAPMTPSIRAALSLPKAMAARRAQTEERNRRIAEVIDDLRAVSPAITDAELASGLNQAGLTTYTKLPFTASRVRRHLQTKGLI